MCVSIGVGGGGWLALMEGEASHIAATTEGVQPQPLLCGCLLLMHTMS